MNKKTVKDVDVRGKKVLVRCDFNVPMKDGAITDENRIGDALSYLMKYIEKSGEKIVYSRGLPQFFISDVMDEDVACTMGEEQEKLVLHDDFGCWVDGEYMGKVCKETIAKMPKAN